MSQQPHAEGSFPGRLTRLRFRLARARARLSGRPYYPDWFDGILTLRYPPSCRGGPTSGWRGIFATLDGQMVTTIARAVIYSDPEMPVWAELTMFTTTAGRPALDTPRDLAGIARKRDGGFRLRTFRYLIAAERASQPAPAGG